MEKQTHFNRPGLASESGAPDNLESCFDATTYVISRRVTRPTIVGTTWLDEMCESTKAPKAMR